MEGNEGGGINVSALQAYLHKQHAGSGHEGEDEETVFSIFVFLTWFYKNVPCFLDSATGNIIASTICLGANLPTTVSFGSEFSKNILGLPKLLPDIQMGGDIAANENSGNNETATTGGNDGGDTRDIHINDPYSNNDYPHANNKIEAAIGNGFNNVHHEPLQNKPEYHQGHSPSTTPTIPQQQNQYDHGLH